MTKSFSKQRDRIGVTDIVRRSDSCCGGLTLGIKVTIECFHAAGGWPQDRVRLNIRVTTGVILSSMAQCLYAQKGIGSQPKEVRLIDDRSR